MTDPSREKATDSEAFNERRGKIAKRMHIAKMGDGFHIIEIFGRDDNPFAIWPGPFTSKRAADLFLDDLLDAYADGDPNDVCRSRSIFVVYEQQARVLEFLEKRENIADLNELARDLVDFKPWRNGPYGSPGERDSEIPF
jgi:hypothetical protein